MGKRKHSRSREKIRRKMQKLKEKLLKYDNLSESSSEDDLRSLTDEQCLDSENYQYECDELPLEVEDNDPPEPVMASVVTVPEAPLEQSGTEQIQDKHVAQESNLTLDPEILQLLGDDPAEQKNYGENLHKDIAPRWKHILSKGLSQECKQDLLKQYLPPENCSNIQAPKLNLEIKAALTDINVKKDLYSQGKQNQLSSSLAAIGKALNWAISTKETLPQVQQIIKPLSDAARLICDCHYKESQSRRFAITNTLNKQTREIVKNTVVDEYLFGSDLTEHLKTSKTIIKSGLELKASNTQRVPFRPSQPMPVQRGALNFRGAPRAGAGEPRRNPQPRRPPPPPPPQTRDRRFDAPSYPRPSARTRQRRR